MNKNITEATLRRGKFNALIIHMPTEHETISCALTKDQVLDILEGGRITLKASKPRISGRRADYTCHISINRVGMHYEGVVSQSKRREKQPRFPTQRLSAVFNRNSLFDAELTLI